jgi:hypothetical protein
LNSHLPTGAAGCLWGHGAGRLVSLEGNTSACRSDCGFFAACIRTTNGERVHDSSARAQVARRWPRAASIANSTVPKSTTEDRSLTFLRCFERRGAVRLDSTAAAVMAEPQPCSLGAVELTMLALRRRRGRVTSYAESADTGNAALAKNPCNRPRVQIA